MIGGLLTFFPRKGGGGGGREFTVIINQALTQNFLLAIVS